MMVAVHPGDLLAAERAGFKTGYVKPKVWEPGADGPTEGFDVSAEELWDFARQMTR